MHTSVRVSLIILICTNALLLVVPERFLPSFYDTQYIHLFSIGSILLIYFLPRHLKVSAQDQNALEKNKVIDQLQILITLILYANILGDLGLYQLYKIGFPYDKFIHFLIPLLCMIFFPKFLHIRFGIPFSRACIYSFIFILSSGILWEISEYLADTIFKTHIFGVYGQDLIHDTTLDLLSDLLGSSIGFLYNVSHFKNLT
jgi:hypothetical protein